MVRRILLGNGIFESCPMSTNHPSDLSGKVAIVTGSSRGLGRATSAALAARGADIVVTYLGNREEANDVVATIQALGRKAVALQLDASDIASFDGFATRLREALASTWSRNRFDFLVNNAGFQRAGPIGKVTEADFDSLCNIHFKGVLFLTQQLLPLISDGGRIVNISSGLTRFVGGGSAAYASMKGAIEVHNALHGKGTGAARHHRQCSRARRNRDRFGGGSVRDNPHVNKAVADNTALGRAGVPETSAS